ncbi:MAG: tRNA (cytidine(34)-2'-O)-methyltransferase [Mariprofundaceae bacterium]
MKSSLHVVLFEPEIPPNTGNIARLCACTACQLHLVHPLGFDITDKHLKRAGLDYWPFLDVQEHANWTAVRQALAGHRWFGLSTKGGQTIWETAFKPGDVLVMGPETRGLPANILDELTPLRIPMRSDAPVRSLNLSSACAIVVYEAMRQFDASRQTDL